MPRTTSRQPIDPARKLAQQTQRETLQVLVREGALPTPVSVTGAPSNLQILGLDGQSRERHVFMLGMDALNRSDAFLSVTPRRTNYYRI